MFFAALSPTSSLWCPDEPNNYDNGENAISLLYYTEYSALFCINDDKDYYLFSIVCEIRSRKYTADLFPRFQLLSWHRERQSCWSVTRDKRLSMVFWTWMEQDNCLTLPVTLNSARGLRKDCCYTDWLPRNDIFRLNILDPLLSNG